MDSQILGSVCEFFTSSRDFNGIPAETLSDKLGIEWETLKPHLSRLIETEQLDAVFYGHQDNPHIKRIPPLSAKGQIERLGTDGPGGMCLYPKASVVTETGYPNRFDGRPFSKRLAMVEPQLTTVFFDLAVVDTYFRDPRYHFKFADFSGSISVVSEYSNSGTMDKRDEVFLQGFGIGYDEKRNRVVVAFLRYLSRLSPEHQQIWKARELTGKHVMNSDYANSTIYGHWPENHSVYEAFIYEQVEINRLAAMMGKPHLFKKTFEEGRPTGFHPMLRPTRRNFNEFILLLDKMLSDNLNKKFFTGEIDMDEIITDGKGRVERRPLGTLKLLERWLSSRYRTQDGQDIAPEVLTPLFEVRRLRQPLAHSLDEDRYDQSFPSQQDELLGRVIHGLQSLRLIFSAHPKARGHYKPPDWLDSDNIVFY
jgi:hypothetical protein